MALEALLKAFESLGGQYPSALELLKKAEAMTEQENVPNYQSRVLLRAATFNNLCCHLAIKRALYHFI